MRYLIGFVLAMLISSCGVLKAQTFTFHHDQSIMGQFTTMETGAGALTPADYYTTLHKSYQADANIRNKNLYRFKFKSEVESQKAPSDTVRANLKRRAIVAELDRVSSDPSMDAAWKIEGPKIESKMSTFRNNIAKIIAKGGTSDDQKNWTQTYNCLQSAINITRKSYLTHGQRQKEYITIYNKIVQKMTALSACFNKWNGYKMVDNFKKAGVVVKRLTSNSTVAYGCLASWQENFSANNASWKKSNK